MADWSLYLLLIFLPKKNRWARWRLLYWTLAPNPLILLLLTIIHDSPLSWRAPKSVMQMTNMKSQPLYPHPRQLPPQKNPRNSFCTHLYRPATLRILWKAFQCPRWSPMYTSSCSNKSMTLSGDNKGTLLATPSADWLHHIPALPKNSIITDDGAQPIDKRVQTNSPAV